MCLTWMYVSNISDLLVNMLLCAFCLCVFTSISVSLQLVVCVCVSKRGSISAKENHPVSLHVSSSFPRRRHSSPSPHRSKSWHMPPMSPLSSSLLSLPHTLCLSVFLAIVTLSLCHSSSLSILYIQLPPWLYQRGFWFHYCRGQSFLFRQGEWNTTCTHSQSYRCTHRNT